MSRGLGKTQTALLLTIRLHGKPMTFAEIRASVRRHRDMQPDERLRPSFERSLRRALHRLVEEWELIAMGEGGRGEPLRYFVHPTRLYRQGPESGRIEARIGLR
jgi:hypothetical protein